MSTTIAIQDGETDAETPATVGIIPGGWLKVQPCGQRGHFSIQVRPLALDEWEAAIAARRVAEAAIVDWRDVCTESREALPFSAQTMRLMLADYATELAIVRRLLQHVRTFRRRLEKQVRRHSKENQHGR
jgi:hypothetical protein